MSVMGYLTICDYDRVDGRGYGQWLGCSFILGCNKIPIDYVLASRVCFEKPFLVIVLVHFVECTMFVIAQVMRLGIKEPPWSIRHAARKGVIRM